MLSNLDNTVLRVFQSTDSIMKEEYMAWDFRGWGTEHGNHIYRRSDGKIKEKRKLTVLIQFP